MSASIVVSALQRLCDLLEVPVILWACHLCPVKGEPGRIEVISYLCLQTETMQAKLKCIRAGLLGSQSWAVW